MKDALLVKTRLDNLRNEIVPQTEEAKMVHEAQINIVSWIYNNGDLRNDQELINKEQNLEEEQLALTFADETGIALNANQAKIVEINNFK